MNTRAEIIKKTKLPRAETAASFIKKKINKEGLPPVLIRAKNEKVFEEVHSYYQDLSELEEPCEAEITANILEVNGGPITNNYVMEQNYKKRMFCQKNVLMRNTINKNEKLNQANQILTLFENPKIFSKSVEPAVLREHPDDSDFFCLRDTQAEEKRENENHQFSFRGMRKKEIPRNYLMDTIEDSMFNLEIKTIKRRASKSRNLRH